MMKSYKWLCSLGTRPEGAKTQVCGTRWQSSQIVVDRGISIKTAAS